MVIAFLTIYLTVKLGFSLQQAGLAMTFFGIGSAIGAYFGGRLADKYGYYRIIFSSLFFGGILFMLLQFAKSPLQVYFMILALSIVAESFRPAIMTAVAAYSNLENRTRSYSLMRLSYNLGWSIGPALGGWLAAYVSYKALFIVDGITCVAASLLFLFLIKNKEPVADKEDDTRIDMPKSAFRDRIYLTFLILNTFSALVFMQLISTLPVFYKQELTMSEAEIGAIMAMNGLIIVLVEMPSVYYLERKFNPLNLIGMGVLLYGFSYVIFNLAGDFIIVAIISMLALTFGEIFNMPFSNTLAMSRATTINRGQYMGLYTMSYSVSHIIAPTLGMGIASRFGFSTLWWGLGAVSLVAFFGYMSLKRKIY
jgi:predicted MFS family arabinose efflux permease